MELNSVFPLPFSLGKKIRLLRKANSLSLSQLGEELGFPKKNADIRIAQYEANTRCPKQEIIAKLAEAFQCTPSFLSAPIIQSPTDLMQFLFEIDRVSDLQVDKESNTIIIDLNNILPSRFIEAWHDAKQLLSPEGYLIWKSSYEISEN